MQSLQAYYDITTNQYIIYEIIDDITTKYKIPARKIKKQKDFFPFNKNIFNKFIVN